MSIQWTKTDDYLIGKSKEINLTNKKIAAFDLDDTLIKPKNKQKYSKTSDDWELYDQSVKMKLRKYVKEGYHIVIISNQKGISRGEIKVEDWQKKLEDLQVLLGIDINVFCAPKENLYRKPKTTLWDQFIKGCRITSFYCGDAAGLPKRKINDLEIPKDFSDSDLKFAVNLNIKFIHRDQFIFNVEKPTYNINYPVNYDKLKKVDQSFEPSKFQEVIINVGLPASGKSTFTKKYIIPHGYEYINQDTLKTKQKCMTLFKEYIKNKKSVVIDNTNLTKETRKIFIDVCKKENVQVRCLLFTTDKGLCMHNSHYRNVISNGNINSIPTMVFNMMNKKYQKPEIEEGFYMIKEIEFSYDIDPNQRDVYEKYFF